MQLWIHHAKPYFLDYHKIGEILQKKYGDDSLIRTRLFPGDISGLTSVPDY